MQFVFTIASLVFLGSLALFAISRNVRRAVGWGSSLGVMLGLWLLAPLSLEAHRLYPQSLLEWFVIVAVLATLFLAIGTLVSLLASWPLAVAEWWPGRNFRNVQAATMTWTLVVLPLGYLAIAAALEWSFFPRLSLPEGGLAAIALRAVLLVCWVLGCWLLYRAMAGRAAMPTRRVAACVLALSTAGLVRLVVEVHSASPPDAGNLPALQARRPSPERRPLLVIGLDGGNWRTLQPLMDQGRAPTFARLAGAGVRGQIEALWPPYWSTPAWGSVITGYRQEELGVYENLGATAPMVSSFELPLTLSLPMNPLLLFDFTLLNAGIIDAAPADRRRLRRPPVWERLATTGVKTAVVYFPFTYPAMGQADYVVSNRAVADIWDMMGIRPGEREQLVKSASNAVNLLASLEEPLDNQEILSQLLPGISSALSGSDALLNPADVLRGAVDVGERMFKMAEEIVRADRDLDLVLLYVGDFDSVSHAFWQYRFPEDYPDDPPSPADISRFGPVMDRYLEHVDTRIAELIASFPTPPNVLIVADHGMQASRTVTLWKAWHSRFGLFVAAGPDVRPRKQFIDVSYLDVVPTILDLLAFQRPADLSGRSVLVHP